jgi:hypothetical protein
MKLDKNLEKKLREIGSKLDAKIKEADALMAEAREAIGFDKPEDLGLYEYQGHTEHHEPFGDYCESDMGEDLVRYAKHVKREWERE